ncbi:NAD-glutamate dehydrogenase [Pistricoccus aurantiacus]|uniref:NAD-glutamate dehydrogenase n=1 Tax=Pistricoccus aurantiacus TaxID=1883414 RepID=A0A5B8SXC0_9GAMM|nr:NAD-glutamate dehydrogenase [Pistricoccus aurantiacus]QEA39448.1 NAD-glutamate dehydrogenase [Pistricoccus aurantiacus]
MQHAVIEDKQELAEQLKKQLEKRLPEDKVQAITAFADVYYTNAPIEDLVERRSDDIYGNLMSLWHFVQQHEPDTAKVEVYNPDFEEHGWQSSHTQVEVLHPDMPFLVDSVRIELNRRGITIHAIRNVVLAVERDAKHRLTRVASALDKNAPKQHESLIVVEIDRYSDPDLLKDIEKSLRDVLVDVRTAVADYEPMCVKVNDALEELRSARPKQIDKNDHEEAIAFLEWLVDDNFTFLGYDEYEINEAEDGSQQLEKCKGSELGVFKLGHDNYQERIRIDQGIEDGEHVLVPKLLAFSKSAHHARVHRPSYPDYISVDRYDDQGRIVGERRFLGLFVASVYNESPRHIPILRKKIREVIELAGVNPKGHDGKQLLNILEVHPREDLFQIGVEELAHTALGILDIRERRRVRLFLRVDRFGKFYSCLVYVPRDVFSTELRVRIQKLLCKELDASFGDFNTYLSESVLARIQLILRFNGDTPVDYDLHRLESKVAMLAHSWNDDLHAAMLEGFGEERANRMMDRYRDAFPAGYRDAFSARTAVYDIDHLGELDQGESLSLQLYRLVEEEEDGLNLKLYHPHNPIPLSDVLPVLENLGLRVLGERPFEITGSDGDYWIHDFNLEHNGREIVDLQEMRKPFIDAFKRIWVGEAENDSFNRLVIGANLNWREVAILRAYARYLKQIRFGLSQLYIANTLAAYPDITRELVTLFELRCDPEQSDRDSEVEACIERLNGMLDKVASLNDDLLIRRYIELIQATLRTNYYQPDAEGNVKDYISFKLDPSRITDMPKPWPVYEIFVYSPRLEGVHLRGGKVARGGLRWSDRHEDFRTEVLGLVKAQQVKNAVIVPTGAKGGFVCKRLPEGDRDAIQQEGIACYKTFIRALLDITDNRVGNDVVPPQNVVRHDDDDPYLVVAADKGTATFSDIANEISHEYGHWLGDAFASGGKHGYDHKGMAITARGAWVSVQRHFRELDIDTQKDEFSVVGIGDMAGDVFGNGMLLSQTIRLVGAFNHLHVFVDPSPDAAASFKERKRLFDMPRSSWEDYDESLISQGGGVFKRSAKSIAITQEMKDVFKIKEDKLTPNQLISAMLKAPVDLLWNGGIGTYVKASSESDTEVGDKANDPVRVDGRELNCRVIGEGGNLGMTQRGRMEAAQQGVRLNTDFIDNACGVNCSDHEVNIKILLNDIIERGDMTDKQRNMLLAEMTDEVADLVLMDNYRQTQSISLSELRSRQGLGLYRSFISELESAGQIDRELEFLPADELLLERSTGSGGLTRPELSVLISYSKSVLKGDLIESGLPDDPYIQRYMEKAFPSLLVERFQQEMYEHRLKREIVATQIANDLVDHMGVVFVRKLINTTGASRADIAQAYVISRDSYGIEELWHQFQSLDNKVSSQVQYQMMLDITNLMQRATRWCLRNRINLSPQECVELFAPQLKQLLQNSDKWLRGGVRQAWEKKRDALVKEGVPKVLAGNVAGIENLNVGFGIIDVAKQADESPQRVAEIFFEIGERLELAWVAEQISTLPTADNWQTQARETFNDDLDRQQLALTQAVIEMEEAPKEVEARVSAWLEANEELYRRWCRLLSEIRAGGQADFPLFAVAIRELVDLAGRRRKQEALAQ